MNEPQVVWQEPAILGEGPLWVADERAIYWVDIVKKKVHRYHCDTGEKKTWQFEVEVTSLAKRASGGLIGTVRDGFALVDLDTQGITPVQMPEPHVPGNRFNDGKIDAAGRYWAGSMDEGEKLASGILYRLDQDLSLRKLDQDYIITNGPAFSPDGKTMYHTDTSKRVIYRFDMEPGGTIHNKQVFIQLKHDEEGYPDGMTVDSGGCIWLAHFRGHRLTRYSPAGEVLRVIPMPVPNITSCTFAGENLDTLYITTARYLLSKAEIKKYPLAGSLFSFKPGVTGLPTPKFVG